MKKKLVILIMLIYVMVFIGGCAKPEQESKISVETLKLESIDTVFQANGSHVECILGKGKMKLSVNADVIIPDEIKIGSVEMGYPAVSEIETALGVENMEEIGKNIWAIKSDGQDCKYKLFYKQGDDYASYYNSGLKGMFENEVLLDEKALSERADEILSDMGYAAKIFYTEKNENMLTCFYSPTLDGIPIVTKNAGLGGTQLYMTENGLGEMLLEKMVVKSTMKDTEILDLGTALDMMELQCTTGKIPLLSEKDEIRYIRLAYYIDNQKKLLPVWCFSIDFPNDKQEYVVYCMNAVTGDIVFDYNSYSAIGEGEN